VAGSGHGRAARGGDRTPPRADIVTASGVVVELQHSPISAETIAEREAFYGRMVWVFDAREWPLEFTDHEEVARRGFASYHETWEQ
jgi:hypothetical protein